MHIAADRKLRVLIIGAGGRDHALAWAFAQSPLLDDLHVAPGSPAMAELATCYTHLAVDDQSAFVELAGELRPDLVVVGAEDLLVAGLADRLRALGLAVLGPDEAAARLEGSKVYSKQLMDDLGIPTAHWAAAHSLDEVLEFAAPRDGMVAVKADGLASGCGAFVCGDLAEVREAWQSILELTGRQQVIVEELISGSEASVMAICDGHRLRVLPVARDYKRAYDGDAGPNTGGMGSHAPSADLTMIEADDLAAQTIQPVIDELARRGTPFRGVVYAGIMLTEDGPMVLEYNCRFGNPETQSLVRVVDEDLLDIVWQAARGQLVTIEPVQADGAAVAVCVATASYPELQLEEQPVELDLSDARVVDGVELFVGFTRRGDEGQLLALGGRAVTVSAWAPTFAEAIDRAYDAAGKIDLAGAHYRADIGAPALDGMLVLS